VGSLRALSPDSLVVLRDLLDTAKAKLPEEHHVDPANE